MRKIIQIIVLAGLYVCSPIGVASDATSDQAESQKAVLVTGASSGIGRRITEALAEQGHFVYAGARKDKEASKSSDSSSDSKSKKTGSASKSAKKKSK